MQRESCGAIRSASNLACAYLPKNKMQSQQFLFEAIDDNNQAYAAKDPGERGCFHSLDPTTNVPDYKNVEF